METKKRYLTGIQSSGLPHLGNLLGAILPAVAYASLSKEPCLYFIADLHSLTAPVGSSSRSESTRAVAATWLACGLDAEKHLLYRQSRVPQVCELAWYLNCITPYPMLANAHAFKKKKEHLASVSAGLFTYPVLMAADVLLYQATHVPVGKDQQQHLEIARDLANAFNHTYGKAFVLPQAVLPPTACQTLVGTDGRKMSKSYGNTLDVLGPENVLRKQVMGIKTRSEPLEAPKDPALCFVYQLYASLASTQEQATMRQAYLAGGYGYAEAKKTLFDLLVDRFSKERERYAYYMSHEKEVEAILKHSETKACLLAEKTLAQARKCQGFIRP